MLLKGALHVHTTCSDGDMTIGEVLAAHEVRAFDFVALTDHDFLFKKNCYDRLSQVRTSLVVFTGMELTLFEKGYIHVNRIQGDRDVLHILNHPADLGLPMDKFLARLSAIREQCPIDAIEVTSKGIATPEFNTPEIDLPKVATDDSHHGRMIGRAWIEMDAPRDKDAIIRAIRAGDFWNCYAD